MHNHPRHLPRPHLVREIFGALGAGNNILWTPPFRQHIEFLSVAISFATDANAANRLMLPIIAPVPSSDYAFPCPVLQTANQTFNYFWSRGHGCFWTANMANTWLGPLPVGFIFEHPTVLRTDIQNIQVGDQITGYTLRYQVWQDPVLL